MAVRWSSENVVAEHRDLQASAMALDCNGEYTILAGRRFLALISLEKPTEIVKRVSRTQQKYDVIACEFHPSQAERNTFVIASGERAEVCRWDDGQLKTLHVLRAHTRTLTDLNWHRFDPHVLSTCSIDTFVYIWDFREARKPVASLSAIAGATQVKWNKINQHYLASGHDCDIRVWDDRKTSQPLQYISAHLSKIHGLDWSPNHENHLVTASNDCTVKFFDITSPRKEENFINTMSPVWRGKYTPFGDGVVTVVMPQLRRGENSLLLWSVSDVEAPVHTYVGHNDIVLEFEWRQSLSNPGDIQMVSWARDHSLRIWNVDHQLQRMCGHEAEDDNILIESTDSELTGEPALMHGESEADAERIESNTGDVSTKNVNEECSPEHPENLPKNGQEIPHAKLKAVTKDAEITSSSVPASAEMAHPSHESDTTIHLDPTPESTLASTPTSSQLLENLPSTSTPSKSSTISVGMSSTLPSMNHPMTLHQEFSLLNTHLDNNQGNSLDVSAGGMEMLTVIGSRTFGQEVSNFDHDASSLDSHMNTLENEETNIVQSSSLDEGDTNDLVTAVKKLARELENDASSSDCDEDDIPRACGDAVAGESGSSFALAQSTDSGIVNNVGYDRRDAKATLDDGYSHGDVKMYCLQSGEDNRSLKHVDINYSESFETPGADFNSEASTGKDNDYSLNIDSSDLQTDVYSAGKPVGTLRKDTEPLKLYFKSPGKGQPHSDETSGSVTSYILTEEDSKCLTLKGDGCHSNVVATRILPPCEALSGDATESADLGEETVIFVVENEVSDDFTGDTEHSSVKPSLTSGEHSQCVAVSPTTLNLSFPLVDVNVAVMDGFIMVRCSDDASIQVPAKLVYLPDQGNWEATEDVCAMLAPQLLEGGVIFPGDNILIFKNQSFLISVNLVLWDGIKHTQISISSPVESLDVYQSKGTNFVMITSNSEQNIGAPLTASQCVNGVASVFDKAIYRVASNSDEPGLFQCDKCDKTYKVRSSLNSHRVTHNAEKMYKCDECDKAFHYSTPLQIHKRTHSDERPYRCQTCSASFRSKANLKYHERLHTGERPISCNECGQGFKDYTSLKRHKTKVHDLVMMKCEECGHNCNSVGNLATHLLQAHNILYIDKVLYKCEKCGETFSTQKAYDSHISDHKKGEKNSSSTFGKLTDYIYRCGLCNMTCHSKSQMVFHIQVHAAVKRYSCRYCEHSSMYFFLLAKHVREEHPNDPPWFCQHCDSVFKTCRLLNYHSCRSVRGDYACPHCNFKTELRHRLFKHIKQNHPEDKAPYYCEFCNSSFEGTNKLRYHQKREHPEEMLALSMQRETTKQGASSGEKTDTLPLDMSEIEMSVEGNTIVYHIPQHLRNDEVFKERVKFQCYYCHAKFPVKNAMTRHILREHPGEKAYKCLICDIFFRTNVSSKNHHRKFHRFSETRGRDPLRNERYMKKKAQLVKEKLEKADPSEKSLYKFQCRFCPMAYRIKRHLIVHYKKWHPSERWDYFPDRPFQNSASVSKKKRKLVFFDCNFDDKCHVKFDDKDMLIEHICNAHGIKMEDADKYISTRTVLETVSRGRIPRNAIRYDRESKGKKRTCKSILESDSEDVDDPYDVEEMDMQSSKGDLQITEDMRSGDAIHAESREITSTSERKCLPPSIGKNTVKSLLKLENISSIRDVRKMLYRCRKCTLCFSTKVEYREHSIKYPGGNCADFLHLNVKPEIKEEVSDVSDDGDDNYKLSSEADDDDDDDDSLKSKERKCKSRRLKLKVECGKMKQDKFNESMVESISVTIMKDEDSEEYKVLFVNNKEIELDYASAINSTSGVSGLEDKFTDNVYEGRKSVSLGLPNSLEPSSFKQTDIKEKLTINSNSQLHVEQFGSKIVKHSKEEECDSIRDLSSVNSVEIAYKNKSKRVLSSNMQCEVCFMFFKTRAELSFHRRHDH